jgi:5-dehydro-4-deoxyglucarate dehydratase
MLTPGELKDRLSGVLVFAPTPFVEGSLELDQGGFRRNMEFLAAGGIDAVAVAGFVGEFSALTRDEYRAVIRTAREALGPDRLIVAGVGYGSELAAEYAVEAEATGADCAMLLPPYLVEPTEDGMVAHVQRVASAIRIGVMVHSMPGFAFSPRLIERLADVPGVVSYKDELGDVRGFAEIVDRVGSRLAYVNGRAELMMGYYAAAGANMLASAIANFDPPLALAAFDAAISLDFPRLRAVLAPRATPWYRLRERNRGFLISVSKASMNLMGLAGGVVRPPLSGLRSEVDAELRDLMVQIGYLEVAVA